jgi:hypothetical protein
MSQKVNERAERAERQRAKKARDAQDKLEKAEKDRVEGARKSERARIFQDFLSGADKSKGCCEPCNYHVKTSTGEFQPCKMGHHDSGPAKEICADCSESRYRPKKRV